MLSFHFEKPRQRCLQTQLLRIGRVDASDQRLNESIKRFFAEGCRNRLRYLKCANCCFSRFFIRFKS